MKQKEMQQLIRRINELAHKHKTEGLTEQEFSERAKLRQIYLKVVRKNFKNELERIEIVEQCPKQDED